LKSSFKLIQGKKIIPDGSSTNVNARDMEYFMKCPLKYLLNVELNEDPVPAMHKALDQTISHSTVRLIINKIPSEESLINQYERRLELNGPLKDIALEEGIKLVRKYHHNIVKIMDKYNLLFPSFSKTYSAYGCTIEVPIHLPIRENAPKKLKPTRYIIVDYSESTPNWNIYGRLWAALVKISLMEEGLTSLEMGILNLKNNRINIPPMTSRSMAKDFLDNVCASFAAQLIYPSIGKHCFGCIYSRYCTDLLTT